MATRNRSRQAFLYIAPSQAIIALVVVFPILYMLYLSFTNMSVFRWRDFSFVGIDNYVRALTRIDEGFLTALLRTIAWTAVNLVLQVSIALFVALVLQTEGLRGKGLYKTVLIVPWAVPGYITALIWKNGMFHTQFGFINKALAAIGVQGPAWLANDGTAFLACLVVNLWLALPYMILVIDGSLQSLDRDYYDAAEIDGAGFLKRLTSITVPLISPIVAPAVAITAFITFKQFDIVYLMTQQTGNRTGADIHMIITYAYEKAFVTNNYGYSSALSIIICAIIVGMTLAFNNPSKLKQGDAAS